MTKKEALKALAEGKKIRDPCWACDEYIYYDGRRLRDEKGITLEWNTIGVLNETRLEEYEEHKINHWYNNIPAGGVLCRVSDDDALDKLGVITSYSHGKYETNCSYWKNAKPLTSAEVAGFLLTACKINPDQRG